MAEFNAETIMNLKKQIDGLTTRVEMLESELSIVRERNDSVDRELVASGYLSITEMIQVLRTISVIVMGDPNLGVRPLRLIVDELQMAYSRAKWVAGTLATVNVGTVLAWLNTLFGK